MANTLNFSDMFSGKPKEIPIDYDRIADDMTLPPLPLLRLTDNLATTADKMETFATVIESGSTLAIRTGTYHYSLGGEIDKHALELAEVQVMQEIVAISNAIRARYNAQMRALTKRIHVEMKVLRTRKDDIGAKIPGSKAHRKRARALEQQACKRARLA